MIPPPECPKPEFVASAPVNYSRRGLSAAGRRTKWSALKTWPDINFMNGITKAYLNGDKRIEYLFHATYVANLPGIMRSGLIPPVALASAIVRNLKLVFTWAPHG
jgi:hypothetical protein